MVTVVWTSKGGSGATVVAATLAVVLAEEVGSALLVDLGGDGPSVLGVPDPGGQGVRDWLASTAGPDALARLVRPGAGGVDLVPAGEAGLGSCASGRAGALLAALAAERRPVVVDAGLLRAELVDLVAGATQSLLVVRNCYLGLRHAVAAPLRPSAVVLVREPGRSLGRADVEDVLGVPVVVVVDLSVEVARAVDAGLLVSRLPRGLTRRVRRAA